MNETKFGLTIGPMKFSVRGVTYTQYGGGSVMVLTYEYKNVSKYYQFNIHSRTELRENPVQMWREYFESVVENYETYKKIMNVDPWQQLDKYVVPFEIILTLLDQIGEGKLGDRDKLKIELAKEETRWRNRIRQIVMFGEDGIYRIREWLKENSGE